MHIPNFCGFHFCCTPPPLPHTKKRVTHYLSNFLGSLKKPFILGEWAVSMYIMYLLLTFTPGTISHSQHLCSSTSTHRNQHCMPHDYSNAIWFEKSHIISIQTHQTIYTTINLCRFAFDTWKSFTPFLLPRHFVEETDTRAINVSRIVTCAGLETTWNECLIGTHLLSVPTHRIHGTIVYIPTWMVDVYGKCR